MEKAFDCVNHDILLQNLGFFGVVAKSYQWFASYLSGRSQQICYHSVLSDYGDVTVGVPQGSILDPLHFSFYVNDLPHAVISSDAYQYADDTLMFYCNLNVPTLEKKLQDDIDSIVRWLVFNKLWINVSRTESVLIDSHLHIGHQQMAVNIAGIPFRHVNVVRYLGLLY